MESLFREIRGQLDGIFEEIRREIAEEGVLPLLQPVPPWNGRGFFAPVAMVGTVLALAALSGIALGAFGVLLFASLALYFLLQEVLGITIEFRPLAAV